MPIFVSIDAALLAVPNHASDENEAEEIIRRVTYWAKPELFKGIFRGVLLSDTLVALTANNYFPSGPNIAALLEMWNLRHVYSSEDVRRSINFILERALPADDAWALEISDSSYIDAVPDLKDFQKEPALLDTTVRMVLSSAMARYVKAQDFSLMVSGLPKMRGDIFVRASANEGTSKPSYEIDFPFSVKAHVALITELLDVAEAIGCEQLWRTAADPLQLHFAIAAKIVSLLKEEGNGCLLHEVPEFSLGSGFMDSLRRNGAVGLAGDSGPLVLEACARLVIKEPKNEISSLTRRNSTGKQTPLLRTHDQAEAKRTHLTKSHEALRLMFWQRADGTLEFANVGPKAEVDILDGEANAEIRNEAYIFQ